MAIDPDDVDAIINAQMAEPQSATVDGNTTVNRSLKDLIALRNQAASDDAVSGWGRNMARVRLPDALGPSS